MISNIDFFMPPHSQYGVLHHMTIKLFEAMQRQNIECRLLVAEKNNPKIFLEQLFSKPPQFTLSFNGLLPDEQGRFFSDMIKIPHVAFLVDAPNHFIPITQSNYTININVDRFGCDFFKGLNARNTFFIPHGVEKELLQSPLDNDRPFDIVYLGSAIDFQKIQSEWPARWGKALDEVLNNAAELSLSDPNISFIQAFVSSLDQAINSGAAIVPEELNFQALLDDLEMYIRGKDRFALINAIDNPVHIIGAGSEIWRKYLPKKDLHVIHSPVSFEEALNIMKQTKILLNSCAWIKNGTHERILAGIASGAAVLTSENIYMREHFVHDKDILFYQHRDLAAINPLIQTYLSNPAKRMKLVDQGRNNIDENHTWDIRAQQLLDVLQKVLPEFTSS